ncbi:MAG TPA: hypothetical protein PKI46_09925, partial [Bacteroidales bacterium]|nr:hypothetical protein [Bacteroidales bacterium]
MIRVFKGDITFNGSGWHKIALQTPYYYSGNNNLQITWINNDGDYLTGYPSFMSTTTSTAHGLYNYQDNSLPTMGGTLVNYYPNIRFSISGCGSDIVPDTAYVLPSAQYELAIEEIVSPTADGCSQPNTNVAVRLHNYGVEAIPAGVELTCIENDTNIISESIHDEILPDHDYYFTFTNPINITYVNGIANVNLKIYHNGAPTYSPVIYNDTIEKTFRLYERPANPIVASSTINFGDIDTLVASSPSGLPVYWYSDPYGSNLLNAGDTLITPHLLDTTIYYLSAGSYQNTGVNIKIVGDMNSTTTTYFMPTNGWYNYSYSSMIYLSSEIGQGELIDT